MSRIVCIVGCLIAVLVPSAVGQHKQRPAKPPRNMFIDLSVERARHTRDVGAYSDRKSQHVALTITLNNRNTNQDYQDLTGYSYVVAQDVLDKRRFKLIIKESETFNLPRGQKIQHETEEVRLEFAEDDSWRHGFKYYGYVYLVEDKQGKVLAGAASVDKLWDKLGKLADLNPDEEFTF